MNYKRFSLLRIDNMQKNMNSRYPIDAVITWVDGNDQRHIAKRKKYGNKRIFMTDDVAGDTRFANSGEIFYCVASLNRFAPWINKIYIVTDEQNPCLDNLLDEYFPKKQIPVEIIDHRTIFRGYAHFLPTFNSISIESMTWRIPGLSEHYIEFNDDFILTAPTEPEDFFTANGKVICYGKRKCSLPVMLTRLIKYHKNGSKKVTFKETMLNAATLLKEKSFFIKIYHTPRALLKSVYESFFMQHPEALTKNIAYRFRHHKQYNPQEIQYLLLYRLERCILRKPYDNLLYLKPKAYLGYTRKKLNKFSSRPGFKFACINSLDRTCKEGQEMIIGWIKKRIGLNALNNSSK